jgi:hypothetical protein
MMKDVRLEFGGATWAPARKLQSSASTVKSMAGRCRRQLKSSCYQSVLRYPNASRKEGLGVLPTIGSAVSSCQTIVIALVVYCAAEFFD